MGLKVSIIVPIYNVRPYMERSIQSMIKQTYKELEILLIDDGSTDGSSAICDALAQKDDRVRVFHKTNGGLSSARNHGLQHITGDLLMFVDSDDWLDPDCISLCVEALQKHQVGCILFPYIREFNNLSKPNYTLGQTSRRVDKKEITKRMFGPVGDAINHPQNMDDLNMACAKLYYAKYIGQLEFLPKSIIGTAEDLAFNAELFLKIDSFYYVSETFYHYNKMNASSITSGYHQELSVTRENLYNHLFQLIQKYGMSDSYECALLNRKILGFLGMGLNIVRSNYSFWKKYLGMASLVSDTSTKEIFRHLSLHQFDLKWRIIWGLFKYEMPFIILLVFLSADRLKSYLK